ncbi:MAG: PqqD family protein [Chloroflexia bacterium]
MGTESETYYKRNPHTAWQIMPEGGMILDLRAHELTATNLTGAAIWQELEEPRTVLQLSEALAQQFTVTPEEALGTVNAFLDQLQEKNLVEIVSD